MKILVTGSHGQLGNELQELANDSKEEFYFTDVSVLDLTQKESVELFIRNLKPDFVVNCAAYTAVDKAEEEHQLAHKINVEATENLVEACKIHDVKLIHISTDFVFDGSKNTPYAETDHENPLSVYGMTKWEGEKKVLAYPQGMVIRTSWLYSIYGNNFVKTMLRLAEQRKELGIIVDQIGTPTWAKDLADAILEIIRSKDIEFGVYHYSNEGVASWYDFAHAIFEHRKIDINLSPISTEAYPTPAERPHFSVMDKGKIKKIYKISIPHWRDSLKKMLEKL